MAKILEARKFFKDGDGDESLEYLCHFDIADGVWERLWASDLNKTEIESGDIWVDLVDQRDTIIGDNALVFSPERVNEFMDLINLRKNGRPRFAEAIENCKGGDTDSDTDK